jgi:hypothetical protein
MENMLLTSAQMEVRQLVRAPVAPGAASKVWGFFITKPGDLPSGNLT